MAEIVQNELASVFKRKKQYSPMKNQYNSLHTNKKSTRKFPNVKFRKAGHTPKYLISRYNKRQSRRAPKYLLCQYKSFDRRDIHRNIEYAATKNVSRDARRNIYYPATKVSTVGTHTPKYIYIYIYLYICVYIYIYIYIYML